MTKVFREDFCLDKDKRCPEACIVMLYGYIDRERNFLLSGGSGVIFICMITY